MEEVVASIFLIDSNSIYVYAGLAHQFPNRHGISSVFCAQFDSKITHWHFPSMNLNDLKNARVKITYANSHWPSRGTINFDVDWLTNSDLIGIKYSIERAILSIAAKMYKRNVVTDVVVVGCFFFIIYLEICKRKRLNFSCAFCDWNHLSPGSEANSAASQGITQTKFRAINFAFSILSWNWYIFPTLCVVALLA